MIHVIEYHKRDPAYSSLEFTRRRLWFSSGTLAASVVQLGASPRILSYFQLRIRGTWLSTELLNPMQLSSTFGPVLTPRVWERASVERCKAESLVITRQDMEPSVRELVEMVAYHFQMINFTGQYDMLCDQAKLSWMEI